MTLDQRLSRAAHHLADRLEPPEVDLGAVRASAVRARRRRMGTAVAVVTTVVAVGVAAGVRDARRPVPVEPVPTPKVVGHGPVWHDAAGLHHGGEVEQTASRLIGSLALVRTGALYRVRDEVWFHPWDGEPRVVGHESPAGPAGDPDGDVAAWFEGGELVVYDTVRRREISRTTGPEVLHRVGTEHESDRNGFLHVSANEVVWRTERAVYRLDVATGRSSRIADLRDTSLVDVHEATRVTVHWSGEKPGLTVDVAGQESVEVADAEPVGRFSADGSYLLAPTYVAGTHGAVVVDVGTGDVWDLSVRDAYAWISWAYDDVAVVKLDLDEENNGPLLACDASRRECTSLPHEGYIVLPGS